MTATEETTVGNRSEPVRVLERKAAEAATSHAKKPGKVRHWLDDPLTDRGLFLLGAGIQVWSTFFMWELATWAYGVAFVALVNVLFFDVFGLLAGRVGADERNATRRNGGVAIRGYAWAIAGLSFAFTFGGNLVAHYLIDETGVIPPQYDHLKRVVRLVLGSLPVLLLVATLVLRTRMKAYKKRVQGAEADARAEAERVAEEERLAAELAERERLAAEAEQERLDAAERERQETARRQAEAERLRAAADLRAAEAAARAAAAEEERQRTERADRERLEREQERLERDRQQRADTVRTDPPVPGKSPEWQAAYDAIPGSSKTEKARNVIRAAWEEGREITGPEVDEIVGASTLGRAQINWLRKNGELPPSERFKLQVAK